MTAELTWHDKANRIIGELCRAEWKRANFGPNGKRYKKPRPYHVPELAQELVECLGNNDELRAKQIFVYEMQTANDPI